MIIPYLKAVQKENLKAVNEALNDIYVEEEDHGSLRDSIDEFDEFDQIGLAQKVEKHELLEFRRISAYLYKKNKRWAQSVALSKQDKMYKDAIDCAAASEDGSLVEELLRFFVNTMDKECFAATLYTCYAIVEPDVALELAWKNGLMDFAMPFMIQYMRDSSRKLKEIDERTKPDDSKNSDEEKMNAELAQQVMYNPGVMQLTNGAGYGDPQMNGMGMPPQMQMPQAPSMGMQGTMGMQQPMGMGQPQMMQPSMGMGSMQGF